MLIHELHLWTANIPVQFKFYTQVLRLPCITSSDREFAVQAGTSRLIFHRDRGAVGGYHVAFNIAENLYEEAKIWLLARVPLEEDRYSTDLFHSNNHWNMHAIYFRDPDENILEFSARHNLVNKGEEPFGPQHLISIGEVGLPAEDVQEQVMLFHDRMSLAVFDGKFSDTFTAMGDDYGLLIIPVLGREWFPETGVNAHLLPVKVVVSNHVNQLFSVSGPPYEIEEL
jgi:catechol-2,3-dioxygenase